MSEKQDMGTVDLVVRSITATQGVNSPNISRIETKTIQNASDSVTISAKLLTQIAEVTSLADDAQADATAALLELTSIVSDDRLSKDEKPWTKAEYDEIIAEQAGIDAQLTNYSLTALKTAYDNAVTALTTYLGTLSPAYTDFTTHTTIVGTTFHSKFADVYAARQAGLDGIAAEAKELADAAQTAAETAQATADAACTRTFDTKAEIEAATGNYDYEIAYCIETVTFWQCGLSGTAFTDKGATQPSSASLVGAWLGNETPEIPDNAAGTTYVRNKNWTDITGWSLSNATASYVDGKLRLTATGANPQIYVSVSGYLGKTVRVIANRISGPATTLRIIPGSGTAVSQLYSNDRAIADAYIPAGATGNLAIVPGYSGAVSGDVYEIEALYIGTALSDIPDIDNSGNGIHGTINGCTPVLTSRGKALSFDGVNDYVSFDVTKFTGTGAFTFSCWIEGKTRTAIQYLFIRATGSAGGRGIHCYLTATNRAELVVSVDGTAMVVLTADAGSECTADCELSFEYSPSTYMRIYKDGVLIKETTSSVPALAFYSAAQQLRLGANAVASYFYSGWIAAALLYSRALTAQEHRGYALGLLPELPYSLADWKLDPTNANNVVTTYAPRYRGIGRLSATTTAAYAGYTVASDGSVTAGSTITPNIGDTMVNYYNGGVSTLGIYKWSGTAWALDTTSATLALAAEDLMHLRLGGITVGDYTTWITAIGKTLFIQEIKLLASGWMKSHNYDETGTTPNEMPTSGFMLDVAGEVIKSVGSIFANCRIQNANLTDVTIDGVLNTDQITTTAALSASFTAPASYLGSELQEAIPLLMSNNFITASGTFNSKTVNGIRYSGYHLGAYYIIRFTDASTLTIYGPNTYTYQGTIAVSSLGSATLLADTTASRLIHCYKSSVSALESISTTSYVYFTVKRPITCILYNSTAEATATLAIMYGTTPYAIAVYDGSNTIPVVLNPGFYKLTVSSGTGYLKALGIYGQADASYDTIFVPA
jgi:hypothetical protein